MENESQRIQVDPRNIPFTKSNVPPVHISSVQIPQEEDVKYLGLHLDRSTTHFRKMETTRNHPHQNVLVTWTQVKTLIYKIVLKPIWTYGIQLWGTTSTSNIEILENFQSKALRMIVDAPCYVPNPKGSPNTNSSRRNLPLQLSMQCSPQCTPK
jgi:hypothetical protein